MSSNVRIHRLRQRRSIKLLIDHPNLQTSQGCCKQFFPFHNKSNRTHMLRPYVRYQKSRKAKFVNLLLRKLSPIWQSMNSKLFISCLEDKLQSCKPFSSSQCDLHLTFGAKPILIEANTFHPHPTPLQPLLHFGVLR